MVELTWPPESQQQQWRQQARDIMGSSITGDASKSRDASCIRDMRQQQQQRRKQLCQSKTSLMEFTLQKCNKRMKNYKKSSFDGQIIKSDNHFWTDHLCEVR
jgi:transposase-like protein